jgi:hypothetical protein
MSNHPNRGWRGRWAVYGQEARHGPSGLVLRFERAPDSAAWDGSPVNGDEVAQALVAAHGRDAASRMLARLMREAGDVFQERRDADDGPT